MEQDRSSRRRRRARPAEPAIDGGSRISQLPTALQAPARLLRRAIPDRIAHRLPGRFAFVYKSDGMATIHRSPFLEDVEFDRTYWRVAHRWPGGPIDIRWRMWLLTECARHCRNLGGGLAEFGVYRGASAFMLLSRVALRPGQTLYLFDTFSGIPASDLTEAERRSGFEGRLSDTSAADVTDLLAPWEGNVALVAGDVLTTLAQTETGPLAFAHLDLNAAAPTEAALGYLYPRLLPGGMIVFDDYGWPGYDDQRAAIDRFVADKAEVVLALPTGQALLVRL